MPRRSPQEKRDMYFDHPWKSRSYEKVTIEVVSDGILVWIFQQPLLRISTRLYSWVWNITKPFFFPQYSIEI